MYLSELNGIDRTSVALISLWGDLNLYIMSILEAGCLPLMLEIRAYSFFCSCNWCIMFNLSKFHSH